MEKYNNGGEKVGNTLIKISVVYFLIGVTLGLYMSVAHDYALTGVHVHINLLGWMSLAIAGIFYKLFPHLAQTATAKVHFWLHNLGLPVMMISLAFVVSGVGGIFHYIIINRRRCDGSWNIFLWL